MQKKITILFWVCLFIFFNSFLSFGAANEAQRHDFKKNSNSLLFYHFQESQKTTKKREIRPLRRFSKQQKNTTPRKGDDLWILRLIFLVAFLSILTFAASAIMLAIYGMSSLWLTLMIISGLLGVLPMLAIGGALLFR